MSSYPPPDDPSSERKGSFGSNGHPQPEKQPEYPRSDWSSEYNRRPEESPPPGSPAPGRPPQPQQVIMRRSSVTPTVTYILLGVTVVVFVLQSASQLLLGRDLVAALGMKVNELILAGQYWRLVTPMFLHGSILHIGFNMYALYVLGPGLERQYGHTRFLALYFLAGFAGNVMSFLFSTAPSLGSSTAIFGLLGAEGVFLYQNRELFGGVAQRALQQVVIIAAINFLIGLSPGIDNWGHLGGFIGGVLFAWYGGPLLKVDGIYPVLNVVDTRQDGDVWRAGLGVAVLFGLLSIVTIFIRS